MARTNTLGNFLTDVANAIRTKKGTQETINAADFDTEIANLPSGGGSRTEAPDNDVNFYDYDGFRVYSYTAQEFLALESMPANPTHDGLTAQGWNWSLSNAQDYVENYGILDIGQNYVTSDGKTRIYITLENDNLLSPTIKFALKGTVIIDWGDETTDTITKSSETTITQSHTYEEKGDYVISLLCETGSTIKFNAGDSSKNNMLYNSTLSSAGNYDKYYSFCINKIELGNNILIENYSFSTLKSLKTITIPTEFINKERCFYGDINLCSICLPNTNTTLEANVVQGCYLLKAFLLPYGLTTFNATNQIICNVKRMILPSTITGTITSINNTIKVSDIIIPDSVTAISSMNSLNGNPFCTHILIGSGVSSIPSSAFINNTACMVYDFSRHNSIPTLTSAQAFDNNPTDYKIVVLDSLYENWIAENNWSSLSSHIIKKSDWDAL